MLDKVSHSHQRLFRLAILDEKSQALRLHLGILRVGLGRSLRDLEANLLALVQGVKEARPPLRIWVVPERVVVLSLVVVLLPLLVLLCLLVLSLRLLLCLDSCSVKLLYLVDIPDDAETPSHRGLAVEDVAAHFCHFVELVEGALSQRVIVELDAVFYDGLEVSLDVGELLKRLPVLTATVVGVPTVDLEPDRLHLVDVELSGSVFLAPKGHAVVSLLDLVDLEHILAAQRVEVPVACVQLARLLGEGEGLGTVSGLLHDLSFDCVHLDDGRSVSDAKVHPGESLLGLSQVVVMLSHEIVQPCLDRGVLLLLASGQNALLLHRGGPGD